MFNGHQGQTLDNGPLELSYRNRDAWPNFSARGSIKAQTFDFGDPDAGPMIQLGLVSNVDGETLDWKHGQDPVHHHGSDQFRVVSGGDWLLANEPLPAGNYSFQEAGWVYQEHPGEGGAAWMLLVMGDRRGAHATLRFAGDHKTFADAHNGHYLNDYGGEYGDAKPYPHPAGHKGLAGISTSAGACNWGYMFGAIADLDEGADGIAALTGVLGDETVGPIVHVLKCSANRSPLPACTYSTETLLIIVKGSCSIGASTYQPGDLRVQPAGKRLEHIVAGPNGLEAVLIIADRRAQASFETAAPAWVGQTRTVLDNLRVTPGGFRRA